MIHTEFPANDSLSSHDVTGALASAGQEVDSVQRELAGQPALIVEDAGSDDELDPMAVTQTLNTFNDEITRLNAGIVDHVTFRPQQLARLIKVEATQGSRISPSDERAFLLQSFVRHYDEGVIDIDVATVDVNGRVVEAPPSALDGEAQEAFGSLAAIYGRKSRNCFFSPKQRPAYTRMAREYGERAAQIADSMNRRTCAVLGSTAVTA